MGVVCEDTSEELVLAAVDGELVNRALGRLSTRHRHVLAMREGSGWTYQQIADHEGVEIGTIETLLWRARQALKREFAVVSESKEALAGFLIATGALIRRTVLRAAHRGATVQHGSGGGSGCLAQRLRRRRRHRRRRCHCIHRAPRALDSAERRGIGARVSPRGSAPRSGRDSGRSANAGGRPAAWPLGGSAPEQSGGSTAGAAGGRPETAGRLGPPRCRRRANGATSLLGGALTGGSSGTSGVSGGLNEAAGGVSSTVNGATGGARTDGASA